MDNIIYGLYCPITKNPVYVGQSTRGINKPFEHIREKSHSKKVNEWVSYLKNEGLSPIIVILETTNNPELLNDKELFWINKLINEGNILLNQQGVNSVFFSTNVFSQSIENDFYNELSLFIKGRRKLLKLTQYDIAYKSGLGLRFIRNLEQGRKNNYNTKTLQKILYLFGAELAIKSLSR